jgi:alpha-L-fucosidase
MHIPDWDEGFLSAYDPQKTAELIAASGAEGAMVYTKSHVGLCYWPTKLGRQHQGLAGRDVLAELVGELRSRDIGVCAYYSVVFDNWAAEQHPDWRQVNAASIDYWPFMRYGVCCPNNGDYRTYE